MLDGTLFVVKCAGYENPGEDTCPDFFHHVQEAKRHKYLLY